MEQLLNLAIKVMINTNKATSREEFSIASWNCRTVLEVLQALIEFINSQLDTHYTISES